ncbi:hypothetical protein T05_2908 [Trichinella murrelli]|uniref:Uncharacterized protein n=1 Tax=Trichinella murrelli TaxID=144512 RepID=A0A0V0UCP8_9BILA|nr:hypothetical protein T05_2908 [Trichinella murrelli]
MIIRYDTSKCSKLFLSSKKLVGSTLHIGAYHQLVNFAVESARLRNIEKLFIVLNKYLRISLKY